MSDYFIFLNALRDLMRPKKLIAIALLVALPAILVLLMKSVAPSGEFNPQVVYSTVAAGLIFGFILVMLSVIFGTSVLSQEIEQKTIAYMLTRPVPRWRIMLMKFAAAFIAIVTTVWFASIATALAAIGPKGLSEATLWRDLGILPIGALAYGAIFLLMATLLNRPLMYGLMFAFGWESWVPNMPGSFQQYSIMAYLRVLAPHPKPQSDSVGMADLLGRLNPQTISTTMAWTVLPIIIVVGLGLALLLFSRNEYVPREDAE